MSTTRVLRMSGTFSLKVTPSTVTMRLAVTGAPHDRAGHAVGDIDAHAVVDAPARMDDVRVVAHFLGLVGDVERIDADAVAAHQAGLEGQEVPLGAGRLEHVARVDAQPVGDQGDLVDQGDVDVALGVLQHLGELGDADR